MNKPVYKRILLARTDRLGDVVLTTPAIKTVRQAYPDAYIAMMVSPYTEWVVRGNPHLNEVIVYDKSKSHRSAFRTVRFAFGLRRKKFDLAVLFHPTNRVHIISYLAGIPRRIGYNEHFSFLLTDRVKNTKHEGKKHELDYNLDMLDVLTIGHKERELYVPIDKEAIANIEDLLEQDGIRKTDKIVTIHPGASCRSKIWPAERFAELADRLIMRYGAKIVVVGGVGERDKRCAEEVKTLMKQKALILSGRVNILELIALLKRSVLFVSNDSGPVHLSVAVKTPVVAIFGRQQAGLSPRRWGPLGASDIILHKDPGCADRCLAHDCRKAFRCLDMIGVEEVLSAIDKMGVLG